MVIVEIILHENLFPERLTTGVFPINPYVFLRCDQIVDPFHPPNVLLLFLFWLAFGSMGIQCKVSKYDLLHQSITQAAAQQIQLDLVNCMRMRGKITEITDKLQALPEGAFLVQFSNHTIALVKGQDHMGLFDPSEGLALAGTHDQQKTISHLLNFYGSDGWVALKVISVQPELPLNHTAK